MANVQIHKEETEELAEGMIYGVIYYHQSIMTAYNQPLKKKGVIQPHLFYMSPVVMTQNQLLMMQK
jgi:hypothetical protein